MSERPIEEVIGWRREPGFGWVDANDDDHDRAEVDDLAAWLDEHCDWWDVTREPGKPPTWWVPYFLLNDATERTDAAECPTIREALTAAARKVAEA